MAAGHLGRVRHARHGDDFEAALLEFDGHVEDDRVDSRVREQHDRVAVFDLVRSQDCLSIALLLVQEAILRGSHVAEHVVHESDGGFNDRTETRDSAGAREGLQRGETAVPGAEGEDEAVPGDRVGTNGAGFGDGSVLGLFHPGELADDVVQVGLCNSHAYFSNRLCRVRLWQWRR